MYHDLEQRTMGGVIRYAAKRWSDRTAIYWNDKKITFKELDGLSQAFAKGLVAKGIQKGDRVGIWMHNHAEWVTAWFGASKIGAVLVPLDYWYKPAEAEYILHHSGARALVISEAMLNVDFPAMVEEIRTRLRGLDLVVALGNVERERLISWEELIEYGSDISDQEMTEIADEIGEHDMEFILYTSGTTGKPKGVVLSHYNVIRNSWDIGAQLNATEKDNILVPVPYSHAFGNTVALTVAVLRGAAQTPMLYYEPKKALEMIDKYGVTVHMGVPTMFIRELHEFRKDGFSLETLRTGIMAGAPCPIDIVEGVLKEMKCNILIGYGQTEASPVITMTSLCDSPEIMATTVGKPLPGIDVVIVDPDTHKLLPVGQQGELVCKGYCVMKGGYFKQPDETKKTVVSGWLHTGDLGTVDEFGYYRITGRAKDMVIVGGFNVYPRVIEEHIITHPKVKEVSVTGVKDPELGEVVAAVVIPAEGNNLHPQDIVDYCYGRMSSPSVPRYVATTDTLPITGRGKVQKFKLKDQLNAKIESGEISKIVPTAVKDKQRQ
jgi:fatty-acyl-CoA synthase